MSWVDSVQEGDRADAAGFGVMIVLDIDTLKGETDL